MTTKLTFRSPVPSLSVAIVAMAGCFAWHAKAATWDISPGVVGPGNGAITGGSGSWNTGNGNWTNDAGASNIAWTNAITDAAIFGSDSGVVGLTTAIAAGSVSFTSNGYLLAGNILTLGGAAPTLNVGSGLQAAISSQIAGDVVNIGSTGNTGTLVLSGSNSHTGVTNVNFGTVIVGNAGAFGSPGAGTVVANGAGLGFQGGVQVLNEALSARGAGVANAGGLRNISGDNSWTGPLTLTNSIAITSNSGTLALGTISAGSRHVIMNGEGNLTVNDVISGSGSTSGSILMQGGAGGAMTLKGADTFTGAIVVSSGTLSLEGNRTSNSGPITVGSASVLTGTLNFSNGNFSTGANNIVVGSSPAVAAAPAGTGIVNHSAGILSTSGLILLGNAGTGNLDSSGHGTYHLSGGKLVSTSNNLAALCLGTNNGGTAIFNLSGNGILEMTGTGLLQVGRSSSDTTSSSGTFTQTGGTATLANLAMGNANNANTTSVLHLSGGTFVVSTGFTAMAAGAASSASITIAGTADVTLPAFPTARPAGSSASITFDGGTLKPAAASTAYLGGLNSATIKAGGVAFDVAVGKDITISQNLLTDGVSPATGLTKLGGGALTLSGESTYLGTTTVSAGTLAVDGSLVSTSAVSVAAASTLAGSGSIGGAISSSGTIAPGNNGIGTLTTGPAALNGGGLVIQVGDTTSDRFQSTGDIHLNGTTLTVTELAPGAAYSYVIAEGTTITGSFASITLPEGYSLDYTSDRIILNLEITVDGYGSWASAHGLNETSGLPGGDPDKDSVNNLLEYVFGGIPAGPEAGELSMLPTQRLNGSHLFFEFDRLSASAGDTFQAVTLSNDLISWTKFADVGVSGEGAVTIQSHGDFDSVSVAIPRSNELDGKLFARLEVTPDFPMVEKDPGMIEILAHWAPVVYQSARTNTDFGRQMHAARDCIVGADFDGDWDAANNWHNSRYHPEQQELLVDRETPPLRAKAYTSVIESENFHFLSYGYYHSGQDAGFTADARHQNDFEQVVLMIRKDGSRFGVLESMMTQFHSDQFTYLPSGMMFSGHRPLIYIEPNGLGAGHGIKAYTNQSPGSAGAVYVPGPFSENVTSVALVGGSTWAAAPGYQYKLVPINEMWSLMGRIGNYELYGGWKLFNYARPQNYPDYEHEAAGGYLPWDRDFFLDPKTFFASRYPDLQAELALESYVFNPYLNVPSNHVGPNNPNGVVPASMWQTTQLGSTSGLAWNHRGETTLYHKNGTGSGDRFTFDHRSVSGDFTIRGLVHSVQNLGSGRVGLMIRSGTAGTSGMIHLMAGPDQRVYLQYRSVDGGSLSAVISGPTPLTDQPVSLRLERTGGMITASYSHDGDGGPFAVLASIALSMPDPVFAGVAASSVNTSSFFSSTITNLEIINTP